MEQIQRKKGDNFMLKPILSPHLTGVCFLPLPPLFSLRKKGRKLHSPSLPPSTVYSPSSPLRRRRGNQSVTLTRGNAFWSLAQKRASRECVFIRLQKQRGDEKETRVALGNAFFFFGGGGSVEKNHSFRSKTHLPSQKQIGYFAEINKYFSPTV